MIISKDVLEHMSETDLEVFLTQASAKTEKMFHIVPLGMAKVHRSGISTG